MAKKTKFLQEGDVIEFKKGDRVYATVPRHFLYHNCVGDWNADNGEVVIDGPLEYLAGRYVVYQTALEGGGLGHGSGDLYPDGHHVFAQMLSNSRVKVHFYQSGCFTVMHENMKPVGKAEHTGSWKIIKENHG